MDLSFDMLSSMSPNVVRSKISFKKNGPSLLSLKKNIRRSSYIETQCKRRESKSPDIIISDSFTDSTDSFETNTNSDSVIVIPDSEDDLPDSNQYDSEEQKLPNECNRVLHWLHNLSIKQIDDSAADSTINNCNNISDNSNIVDTSIKECKERINNSEESFHSCSSIESLRTRVNNKVVPVTLINDTFAEEANEINNKLRISQIDPADRDILKEIYGDIWNRNSVDKELDNITKNNRISDDKNICGDILERNSVETTPDNIGDKNNTSINSRTERSNILQEIYDDNVKNKSSSGRRYEQSDSSIDKPSDDSASEESDEFTPRRKEIKPHKPFKAVQTEVKKKTRSKGFYSTDLPKSLQINRINTKKEAAWMKTVRNICDPDTSSDENENFVKELNFTDDEDEKSPNDLLIKAVRTEAKKKTTGKGFHSTDLPKSLQINRINTKKEAKNMFDPDTSSDCNDGGFVKRLDFADDEDDNLPIKTTRKHVTKKSSKNTAHRSDLNCNKENENSSQFSDDSLPKKGKPKNIKNKFSLWIKETDGLVGKTKKFTFLQSLSGSVCLDNCHPDALKFRAHFKITREELCKKLFDLYNESVFNNQICADTTLEWNDKMHKTAGLCRCSKVINNSRVTQRRCRIVLASKVIDSPDRLRDTLIHEMCHAATWIVNQVSDGHGQYWKKWADKAMFTFPELPPIKRCHDYDIKTKYTYKCIDCGYSIGRHTKSLNVERKRCGYCYGMFEVFLNKTTKTGKTTTVLATPKKKELGGFALYVKENYKTLQTPQLKHKDVMQLLGVQFSAMKVAKGS